MSCVCELCVCVSCMCSSDPVRRTARQLDDPGRRCIRRAGGAACGRAAAWLTRVEAGVGAEALGVSKLIVHHLGGDLHSGDRRLRVGLAVDALSGRLTRVMMSARRQASSRAGASRCVVGEALQQGAAPARVPANDSCAGCTPAPPSAARCRSAGRRWRSRCRACGTAHRRGAPSTRQTR